MADYTPTTTEVLAAYVIGEHLTNSAFPVAETEQCFRNWLAEHDRLVAEKAWNEGWNAGHDDVPEILGYSQPNPYYCAAYPDHPIPVYPEGFQ